MLNRHSRQVCELKTLVFHMIMWRLLDDRLGKGLQQCWRKWNDGHSTLTWNFRPSWDFLLVLSCALCVKFLSVRQNSEMITTMITWKAQHTSSVKYNPRTVGLYLWNLQIISDVIFTFRLENKVFFEDLNFGPCLLKKVGVGFFSFFKHTEHKVLYFR